MSGTLPSANTPPAGGRVASAAKTTLKLGSAAFNVMFPTIGKMMKSSSKEPQALSINMSSEDVSQNLFRQIGLTRRILENQQEQNRLLERLLLVYKSKQLPTGITPILPPPTPNTGGADFDLPGAYLPDRRQPPRAQPPAQAQRPATTAPGAKQQVKPGYAYNEKTNRYRDLKTGKFVKAAEALAPRPTAAARVASAIRVGARLAARFLGPVALLIALAEGLNRLGEQSIWLSASMKARLTRNIAALQKNIEDYQKILQELQNEEDEEKATQLSQDLEQLLQAITVQRDSIVATAAQLDADMAQEMRRRRRGDPRPPSGFTFTQSVAQLVGQASLIVSREAETPRPEAPRQQDPLDAAINAAESVSLSSAIDAALNASNARPQQTPTAASALTPAVRVEGDAIVYDFEKIKFEANLIKFDGLSLPTRNMAAEPAAAAPSAVPPAAAAVPPMTGAATGAQPMQSVTQPSATPTTMQTMLGGVQNVQSAGTPNAGSASAAMQFFQSRGWTPAQAAGFAANLQVESNFNPAAVGDGGRAYGIAQWHPDRQAAFQRWAGRDIRGSTFEQQLEFMQFELTQGNERRAGAMIRQATTPEQAAAFIDQYYERSNGHARQRRMQLAASFAGNVPVTAGQQPVQTPASSAPALAQASTERVVADREQMRNTQILLDTFNARLSQRTAQPNEQAAARQAKKQEQSVGEVPLRSRILEAFNYLIQAS